MTEVDHIGIAVRSIQDRIALYKALGFENEGEELVGSEKVRVAFLVGAGPRIELLEPTAPDSPISAFLAKRGEGMHHVCVRVHDIRATMADLRKKGFRLLSDDPRPGADGSQICFVHPGSCGGVLIELSQPGGGGHGAR